MSTVTYDTVPPATRPSPSIAATAPAKRGFWLRLFDRMVEARMRQAEDVIRRHQHLLPRELEDAAAWRITERSEDSLPFIR